MLRRRQNPDVQWTLYTIGVFLASALLLLVALTRQAARREEAAAPPPTAALLTPTPPPPFAPATATTPTGGPAGAPAIPPQGGALWSGPAPILMYHYVRAVDHAADPLGWELSVTPALFEQHMAALAQAGYTGVQVDLLARCMRGAGGRDGAPACPARPVALTFDDGYEDAFTVVLPALRRHGFTATFYIVTGFVGQPGYMGWEQLAALRDAGMEIGSHTISHPDLTTLDAAELERQVAGSRAELEARLGVRVVSFCYPAGRYNAAVVEAVRAAGYENATTTRWDFDYADALALPRRRVAGGTTAEELGWIVAN
ncbi:MAG TPA: polysaccharide deacetylase family protein [Roseiflexaceae bacterium]|nr:polysaccharide deacetylase family protein [Roseiflexaceae bacterium]